jgi:predicted Zn finger-like uncharacterized protein
MRLACPNCDAQYEVPDTAIPAGGRDVQCSNCGHFWYQMPVRADGSFDEDPADDGLPAGDSDIETAEESIARALGQVETAPEPATAAPIPAASLTDDEEEDETTPLPVPAAPRPKSLDDSLVALLKEEAEREVEARKAEARQAENRMPETQGDLGLSAPDEAQDRARRLAALQGEPEAAPVQQRPTARRDLLPDVDAINSTLQSSSIEERNADAEVANLPDLTAPRRGFRSGFTLMMVVLVVGIAAYLAAPQLKAQFPAAATAIDSYVNGVNDWRQWLDRMMNQASSALSDQSGN